MRRADMVKALLAGMDVRMARRMVELIARRYMMMLGLVLGLSWGWVVLAAVVL